jgi:hypothetical protein
MPAYTCIYCSRQVLNRYIPVHPGTSQHVLVHPVSTCAGFAPGCTLLARLRAAHTASSSMRSSHSKVKRQQLYSFTVTHPPYLGAGGPRGRRRRSRRRGAAARAEDSTLNATSDGGRRCCRRHRRLYPLPPSCGRGRGSRWRCCRGRQICI